MDKQVVARSDWLLWFRALPRASMLVLCGVLLAAVQAILGLLGAPVWTRVAGAVLVATVAATSELDKLRTHRREQRDAEQQAKQANVAAEAEWLRHAQDFLRLWPAASVAGADPYALGVKRSQLAEHHTPPDKGAPSRNLAEFYEPVAGPLRITVHTDSGSAAGCRRNPHRFAERTLGLAS